MEFFFGWITKPKLQISFLDEVVKVSEIALVLLIGSVIWIWMDQRRIQKIKDRHGKHCTCWTCLGRSR